MMKFRLSSNVANALSEFHLEQHKEEESASFVLGNPIQKIEGFDVVAAYPNQVKLIEDPSCGTRSRYSVSVNKEIKARFIFDSVEQGAVWVATHAHQFTDLAAFSSVDDEDQKRDALWYYQHLPAFLKNGQNALFAYLLLAKDDWAGKRIEVASNNAFKSTDYVVDLLGERFRRFGLPSQGVQDSTLIRHKDVVSVADQHIISSLSIALVGAGGTGSIALEALVRAGFRKIYIIDADEIETSNLNRLQGTSPQDVGRNKAVFLTEQADRIAPTGKYKAIAADAFSGEALDVLRQSDVILGCVDNHETRWYLNRLAVQYLLPYFDCGVRIYPQPEVAFQGRVNIVIPGLTPCGHCSDVDFFTRKRPDRFVDKRTLEAQRQAGYIKGEGGLPSPATYMLNAQTASLMVQELLNWICGWQPLAHSVFFRSQPAEIQRLDRGNYPYGPADDCPLCSFLLGACDTVPLPKQKEIHLFPNLIKKGAQPWRNGITKR